MRLSPAALLGVWKARWGGVMVERDLYAGVLPVRHAASQGFAGARFSAYVNSPATLATPEATSEI